MNYMYEFVGDSDGGREVLCNIKPNTIQIPCLFVAVNICISEAIVGKTAGTLAQIMAVRRN